jgi:hypothetical protein
MMLSLPNSVLSLLSVYTSVPSVLETVYVSVQRVGAWVRWQDDWKDDGSLARLRRLVVPGGVRAAGFHNLAPFEVGFQQEDFRSNLGQALARCSEVRGEAKKLFTTENGVQVDIFVLTFL